MESPYHTNVFAVRPSERLCPAHLARIALQIEIVLALRPAKVENLVHYSGHKKTNFTVVSDKSDTMSRINRSRAEIASLNSHPIFLLS